MNLHEVITELENYNKWRRGANIPMPHPTVIGEAIDIAVHQLKNLLTDKNNGNKTK